MNDQAWFQLEQQYFELFGENIPMMMLPADQKKAMELVKRAIAEKASSILETDIPVDAQI